MPGGGPDPGHDLPDQYVVEQIRRALAEDSRAGVLDVDVAVAGGKVFLTGTVATAERLAAISEVVGELLPDRQVHNELAVDQLSLEPDSAARRIEPEHLR